METLEILFGELISVKGSGITGVCSVEIPDCNEHLTTDGTHLSEEAISYTGYMKKKMPR